MQAAHRRDQGGILGGTPTSAPAPETSLVQPVSAPTETQPLATTNASTPGTPLTTAQIVARREPSVALVKGKVSSGTGFIVRHGVITTNAHVIEEEFISNLEIRFPSAPAGGQGPVSAQLLYEDRKRDLAFLAIKNKNIPCCNCTSYS